MKPEFATEPRKILVPDRIKLDQLINWFPGQDLTEK
jgi:hypothetical protein